MRYLNTVYIRDHQARVQHRRGALLVSSPDGSRRIPLEAVDAVVLLGAAQITTQAMEACSRRGVRVSSLSARGSVRFVVSAKTGGNVHLRLSQYKAVSDEAHSLGLSKAIVAAKLQNSRHVVSRWARDTAVGEGRDALADRARQILDRVPRVRDATTADHVRGFEGFVVSLVRRRQVGTDSFQETPGGGVYLTDEGRTLVIKAWEDHKNQELHHAVTGRQVGRWALPSVQATLLARHLRGDLPAYPPFVLG